MDAARVRGDRLRSPTKRQYFSGRHKARSLLYTTVAADVNKTEVRVDFQHRHTNEVHSDPEVSLNPLKGWIPGKAGAVHTSLLIGFEYEYGRARFSPISIRAIYTEAAQTP